MGFIMVSIRVLYWLIGFLKTRESASSAVVASPKRPRIPEQSQIAQVLKPW